MTLHLINIKSAGRATESFLMDLFLNFYDEARIQQSLALGYNIILAANNIPW